jgi:hypothetical protein
MISCGETNAKEPEVPALLGIFRPPLSWYQISQQNPLVDNPEVELSPEIRRDCLL